MEPVPECKCEDTIRRQTLATPQIPGSGGERFSVIEVSIPLGARRLCGLLGARFSPGSEKFLVEVRSRARGFEREVYRHALIADHSDALCGRPDEFADSVMAAASTLGLELGPGELVFEYAAHDLVGSSVVVFRGLARLVIQSLAADPERQGAAALLEGLRSAFPPMRFKS